MNFGEARQKKLGFQICNIPYSSIYLQYYSQYSIAILLYSEHKSLHFDIVIVWIVNLHVAHCWQETTMLL